MARKKALNKDIRVEIKKSLGRYISIFLIVALGVSFFSGLRSTESDMRYTGDAFSDASNLMDIRVISTMGLTDDDVEALSQIEGISGAEPGYMKDVITKQNETDYVVELLSMPEKMNQIQVTEGRLPENENECLLDNRLKKAFEVKVGDTISFVSGTDTELSEDLTQTSYTVTGFGDSPLFISMERGSSMIGSGQINGFAIVQKDVFTQDYYTQIYLTAADAYDEIAFTDAYTQAVEPVQKRVEALEEERCQARYDEVTKEPIAQQEQKAKNEAYQNVFEAAEDFTELTEEAYSSDALTAFVKENGFDASIDGVAQALSGDGSVLGYVITVTDHEGYGGDIQFTMGVADDGTLNGISLLSISETAGLGMRAGEVLVPQFAGKQVEKFSYTKTGAASDDQIDAISGATITTNAVVNGVNAGLLCFQEKLNMTEGGAANE